jgi:hypothetical protein
VRRATTITLVILFVILLIATVAQLNQPAPSTPFPGPSGSAQLPLPST